MVLSKQGDGEWLSKDGMICVQCPHKMDPNDKDRKYYAFKTLHSDIWGPFDTLKKVREFFTFHSF
jgi:hypothetical protein